jgi:hypothetical protein
MCVALLLPGHRKINSSRKADMTPLLFIRSLDQMYQSSLSIQTINGECEANKGEKC